MRTILVIIDGGADRPIKELNNKTPFEAAKTPNLDWFARRARCGLVYTVGKNIAPESDVAVTALLGYSPYKYFTGRGPVEAYGAGMKLPDNFLALRANFAILDGDKIIDRRVKRSLTTKEAHALAAAVNKEVKLECPFEFKSTTEHRGALVLSGRFSDRISNVDPAYKKVGMFGIASAAKSFEIQECKPLAREAGKSAFIINEFVKQSRAVLEKHPVNMKREKLGLPKTNAVLLRDAGNSLPVFPQHKDWAAVVGMPLEIGLAKLAGMQILMVKYPPLVKVGAYRHLYRSLNAEIKASLKALKKSKKSLYVHFKPTDIPGHDGLPKEKKKMIEIIDRKFFSKLRKLKGIKLIVTCDHSTPCALKAHSSDPVPLLLYDGRKRDKVWAFSEKACRKGSLGALLGKDVIYLE